MPAVTTSDDADAYVEWLSISCDRSRHAISSRMCVGVKEAPPSSINLCK